MPYRRIHHDSRHPFEWVLVFSVFVYSIIQAVFDVFPGAIDSNVNGIWKYVWGVLFLLGTGLTLTGITIRRDTLGLTLEQIGLVFTGGCSIVYSFAAFSVGQSTAWLVGCFFGAFGTACFMRWWIIRKDMKDVANGKFRFATVEVPVIGVPPDRSEEGGEN